MEETVKLENISELIEKMSIDERFNLQRFHCRMIGITSFSLINFDGFVRAKEEYSLVKGTGDAYVYIWKHIFGDIFYVGSGVKDRWKEKTNRCNEFFDEIDHGDCVVYKVVSGLSRESARLYEKYLSYHLSKAGFPLKNSDNIYREEVEGKYKAAFVKGGIDEEEEHRLVDVVSKVICDEDFRYNDFRAINKFKKEYGDKYFSRTFSRK